MRAGCFHSGPDWLLWGSIVDGWIDGLRINGKLSLRLNLLDLVMGRKSHSM